MKYKQEILLTVFTILLAGLVFWFAYSLFHYNHKYQVLRYDHITTTVYSDNEYEVGNNIVYKISSYGNIEGTSPYLHEEFTATVTKIER